RAAELAVLAVEVQLTEGVRGRNDRDHRRRRATRTRSSSMLAEASCGGHHLKCLRSARTELVQRGDWRTHALGLGRGDRMPQRGEVFKLKTSGADGKPMWS